MKSISKYQINEAFKQSFIDLCRNFDILPFQLTLKIRVIESGTLLIQVCEKDIVKKEVPVEQLFNRKLLCLRLSVKQLERLFKTIHKAFMIQTQLDNPVRISLLLYLSKKASCPCVGVFQDDKPLKLLLLSDVIAAIEMESEQLN